MANIAAPTGYPGFDVLDVDGSGWAAFRQARAAGLLDGWVRAVRTPSGGLHLHVPGTEQRNGSARGQHLDFRGHGGYVLLPPSLVRTPDYVGSYEGDRHPHRSRATAGLGGSRRTAHPDPRSCPGSKGYAAEWEAQV